MKARLLIVDDEEQFVEICSEGCLISILTVYYNNPIGVI